MIMSCKPFGIEAKEAVGRSYLRIFLKHGYPMEEIRNTYSGTISNVRI